MKQNVILEEAQKLMLDIVQAGAETQVPLWGFESRSGNRRVFIRRFLCCRGTRAVSGSACDLAYFSGLINGVTKYC